MELLRYVALRFAWVSDRINCLVLLTRFLRVLLLACASSTTGFSPHRVARHHLVIAGGTAAACFNFLLLRLSLLGGLRVSGRLNYREAQVVVYVYRCGWLSFDCYAVLCLAAVVPVGGLTTTWSRLPPSCTGLHDLWMNLEVQATSARPLRGPFWPRSQGHPRGEPVYLCAKISPTAASHYCSCSSGLTSAAYCAAQACTSTLAQADGGHFSLVHPMCLDTLRP